MMDSLIILKIGHIFSEVNKCELGQYQTRDILKLATQARTYC